VVAGPIVIGHRGASGYRPEHTLASYRLAIEMGADFIEPDLVSTRDHVLVARHEPEISSTTDVAARPEFADRRTTKLIDGMPWTGWFTDDFTLSELRTLRAVERLPAIRPDNVAFDGQEVIPTFEEVVECARRWGVGLYPETKHPSYFRSVALPLEEPLLDILAARGYTSASDPVFIQSFEADNLQALRRRTDVRLVQLLGDPDIWSELATPRSLAEIARYADGIGPAKGHIVPWAAAGRSQPPTSLVADAHAAGLLVHPWTFRRENAFLPLELRRGDPDALDHDQITGDLPAELQQFFDLGVDGVFTDHPDVAVAVRTKWRDG
jgi:glycerophosphoryl diester phosphodiesterase